MKELKYAVCVCARCGLARTCNLLVCFQECVCVGGGGEGGEEGGGRGGGEGGGRGGSGGTRPLRQTSMLEGSGEPGVCCLYMCKDRPVTVFNERPQPCGKKQSGGNIFVVHELETSFLSS